MRTKKEKTETETELEPFNPNHSDVEILNSIKIEVSEEDLLSKESDDLFQEFNSFLEEKAKMVPDSPEKRPTISTGIRTLDAVLGGGFAVGALNIVVGQPGSGKSMLAAQTLGRAQQIFKGKLLGGYLDSEESMTKDRLSSLGVNFPQMTPYSDMTVEKVFRFLEGMCLFKEKKGLKEDTSVIIWDSIANTLSEKEREADDPNSVLGYKARMLSLLVPKYVAKAALYNICLLAVNQYRDIIQIGMFKPPKDLKMMSLNKDMPGGNVLKFNAFHLVEMRVQSVIDSDKYGFDGIISRVKCVKNKLFTPNIELDIVGSFIDGFSDFWSGYNFMVDTKRLTTGAWNYLVSTPHKKFRTKDAFELYTTDEEFKNAFDEALNESIDTEIIQKYSRKPIKTIEKEVTE
jgi:RecA/RadA recombinase